MLKAEPKVPGSLLGDVLIDSDGGSATIRVTVTVDSPNVPPSRRSPRVPLERGYYQGDRLATWWQRALAAVIDLVVYIPGLTLWSVGLQSLLPAGQNRAELGKTGYGFEADPRVR